MVSARHPGRQAARPDRVIDCAPATGVGRLAWQMPREGDRLTVHDMATANHTDEARRATATARHAPAQWSGHVVLCGLDRLGFRTLEELRRLGEDVVVIAREPGSDFAPQARALGAALVDGCHQDEATLRAAGVPAACALVLTDDDDIGNLHTALAAQELNPTLRVVVRMFNLELGQRICALFRDATVLSASALSAPGFVAAALQDDWEQRLEIAGRPLLLREIPGTTAGVPGTVLPLARLHADGAVTLFPPDGMPGDGAVLCLTDGAVAPASSGPADRRGGRRRPWRARLARPQSLLPVSDRRVRLLLLVLLALAVLNTAALAYFTRLTPLNAAYFVVTFLTTTEFGNLDLRDAPAALKLFAIGVMLVGAASLVAFYALVTDALIGARLTRLLGELPRRLHGHVIVCGVGTVGYRIIEHLARLGIPAVAVEVREDSRFLAMARRRGVPVLVADASLPDTLRALNVSAARCLIAATGDDIANLEVALNARMANPELRVVLRLFDHNFAARVERVLGLQPSRSVTALAAPAFALAAVGRQVLATVPVGRRRLVIAEAPIVAGSPAAGGTVAALERQVEGRVLLLSAGDRQQWRPAGDTPLTAGQALTIVATGPGLTTILTLTGNL